MTLNMFLTQPNQPKHTCGRPYPIGRALSELRIAALPYWTNTFGARGMEEFFEGLFTFEFLVGFEPSFARPEPQLEIRKKKVLQKTLPERAQLS